MKVGFIGLGKMGRPMSLNLVKAGFEVTVHNRSRGVVDELTAQGARAANGPSEVAAAADVILTALPTLESVEEVYFGSQGLIPSARPDQILIDHSTVCFVMSPRTAE